MSWEVSANDINQWTNSKKHEAQDLLPRLVHKLIRASTKPTLLHCPSGDSTSIGGYDGKCEVTDGNEFVPVGISVWECGTNQDIKGKADEDYSKRSSNPGEILPINSAFIFVTSRTWSKKDEWISVKNSEEIWKEVKALNADDLEAWLHQCPSVHRWFARLIGKLNVSDWDIDKAYEVWSHDTKINLTSKFVLSGRDEQISDLKSKISVTMGLVHICATTKSEAYAFSISVLKDDETFSHRLLVVKDQKSWDLLLDTTYSLVLIPYGFDPKNVGAAALKHFVIIFRELNKSDIKSAIEIRKMTHHNAIVALKSLGLDDKNCDQIFADTHGYYEPMRRHPLIRSLSAEEPNWVNNFSPTILSVVFVLEHWNKENEKDREIISQVANMPYEEFEAEVQKLAQVEDAPIRLINNIWQLISKIDFWFRISHKCDRGTFDRLGTIVSPVLGEVDPSFELAPSQRAYALMHHKTPNISGYLKEGLANSLALISSKSNSCNIGINPAESISVWIKLLLEENTSAARWYSYGQNLVLLVEAAPDQFINILDSTLNQEHDLELLFDNEGDAMFGGCPYCPLLWSLEQLSWNPMYIALATKILAKLARLEFKSSMSNSPLNSLVTIYLGWVNYTGLQLKDKQKVLEAILVKDFPDVAEKVLLQLLPGNTHTASPTSMPEYRNWAEIADPTILQSDYYDYISAVINMLLELSKSSGSVWNGMIESLGNVSDEQFNSITDALLNVDLTLFNLHQRIELMNAIRHTVSHHRQFPDTDWAMHEERLSQLEKAYYLVEVDDPVDKYQYLFDNGFSLDLLCPLQRDDDYSYEQTEAYNLEFQKKALIEIVEVLGKEGLERLIDNCQFPGIIGDKIASCDRDNFHDIVISWLDSSKNYLFAANGYFSKLYRTDATSLFSWFNANYLDWENNRTANFLLTLPLDDTVVGSVVLMDKNIQKIYWKTLNVFRSDCKKIENVYTILTKLIENENYTSAITMAEYLIDEFSKETPLDDLLIYDIMYKFGTSKAGDPQIVSRFRHSLEQIIKYLQKNENLPEEDLSRLEWLYLPLVKPINLEKEVLTNPETFVQLIQWIYKPKHAEREVEEDLDIDALRSRANAARDLYDKLSKIPGQNGQDVEYDFLSSWVSKARKLLQEIDRKEIGEDRIGSLLAKSPVGNNGIWPHEAVCKVIDEVDSESFDIGFIVGKENLRGMTSRGIYEGGNQERILSKKFEEYANAVHLLYPKTGQLLRRLAKDYLRDADREDSYVELKN